MQKIFHTPDGVRDIVNTECTQKRMLEEKLRKVFIRYGCREIETPTFEFFEVFSSEVGTIPSRELYKFFDREGNTLVLRPDFTPSVSRACAAYFDIRKEPVSLFYTGQTFINHSSLRGQPKETTQMGVEHFGDASCDADCEILAMTAECLLEAGLTEFQVSIGQVEYFKSLIQEAGLDEETTMRLRELISQKNEFGVEALVNEKHVPKELARAFVNLPALYGGKDVLDCAESMTANPQALKAVHRLRRIYEILSLYGYEKYISFDFGMLSKFRYYTGIIFHAFTYGTGEPVIKGGRYDQLLKHFGTDGAAIGFGIVLENLLLALDRQKLLSPVPEDVQVIRYLPEEREDAIRRAVTLRREGHAVRLVKACSHRHDHGMDPCRIGEGADA